MGHILAYFAKTTLLLVNFTPRGGQDSSFSTNLPQRESFKLSKNHPNIVSSFFLACAKCDGSKEVKHYFKGENLKSQNRGIEAYFSASDASWGLWSSVIIAKALNCALG